MEILIAFLIGAVAGWSIKSYFNSNNEGGGGEEGIDITHKLITNADAKRMIDNFPRGEHNNYSGHFTIEEIMGFVNYVSQNNQHGKVATGLEIFFAQYDDESLDENNEKGNKKGNTLIIYPTILENNKHMPFNCMTGNTLSGNSFRLEDNGEGNQLAALNKSNMRPPNPLPF